MRTVLIPIICLAFLSFNLVNSEKKAKKVSVSGTVTQTRNYCGGARPSDEIINQLRTPRPVSGKKIYIKKGEVNSPDSKVILTLRTDANGNFKAKLRPGKYLVVDSLKKDMTHYNMLLKTYKNQTASYEPIDTTCLKEWFATPAGTFEVIQTGAKDININFLITCRDVPCAGFRGPYPQ